MAGSNPSVSVFHFTSRISSAKIRKYKLATERGMNAGASSSPLATATDVGSSQHVNGNAGYMEPPTKKPKLKLNVRPPPATADADTIAVSRPKREGALKIRYSENMVIDTTDHARSSQSSSHRTKSLPAATTNIPSAPAVVPKRKEPSPVEPPRSAPPKTTKPRDYSRDFMSFYVEEGDEEDEQEQEEEVAPPPVPEPKKPEPPVLAQKPIPSNVPTMPSLDKSRRQSHPQPPPMRAPSFSDPRLQPPPQPTVHLYDSSIRSNEPRRPLTIPELVVKLEKLIVTLVDVSGRNTAAQSPREEAPGDIDSVGPSATNGLKKTTTKPPAERTDDSKEDVDTLLALFDDDDDDDDEDHADTEATKGAKPSPPPDCTLVSQGEPDQALIYGIVFIQNALRSWAHTRLTNQYTQQYMQWHQDNASGKRPPGRPRKYTSQALKAESPPPLNISYDLAETPEGAAIIAFREVLDSEILRVNAIFPVELSRTMRRLYMQIDTIINTNNLQEPPWVCMSYGAQIAAQQSRVGAWEEAHAKAQQELARQHNLAHQEMMEQMGMQPQPGMPPHLRGRAMHDHLQHQHAIELERKRSRQHAAQQPHLTKYLTNPLRLDAQPDGSMSYNPVQAPLQHPVYNTPPISYNNNIPNGPVSSHPAANSSPADTKNVRLDKITQYMPNYLPRSGQSMKFSFAPTSELALKTFGAQAFPTNHRPGPMLPNRGPMSANPYYSPAPENTHVPSNVPNGDAGGFGGHGAVQTPGPNAQEPRSNGSGFTPINAPRVGAEQVNGGAAREEAMVVD